MSENDGKIEYLNRYTYLQYLLHVLYNEKLTLSDTDRWEDKNDTCYIELYKNYTGNKSILALCFVEYNKKASPNSEKYSHWKIYAGNTSGVCIQFDKNELIKQLKLSFPEIEDRGVQYYNIHELKKLEKDRPEYFLKNLPFIKRKAFDNEGEYRFIYKSKPELKPDEFITANIPLNCIASITLNPWIRSKEFQFLKTMIKGIKGCSKIEIKHSTCLDYDEWKKVGEDAVNGIIKEL